MNKNASEREHDAMWQYDENDLLDPGVQIVRAIVARAERAFEGAAAEARRDARLWLLRQLVGQPRRFQPGQALVCWQGAECKMVANGTRLASEDGREAVYDGPTFALGVMVAVSGPEPQWVDLTPLLLDPDCENPPHDEKAFDAVTLAVRIPPRGSGSYCFPGLVWELTPVLSSRIEAVDAIDDSAEFALSWHLDREGRVVIPTQEMPGEPRALAGEEPLFHVRIRVQLDPGDLRHATRPVLNVSLVKEAIHVPRNLADIPPGTFCRLVNRMPGVSISQPFAGRPAVAEEDLSEWEARAEAAMGHRGRAVTNVDFVQIAREHIPDARLVDIAPTRILRGDRHHDAVRLTVVPAEWETEVQLLARSCVLARSLEKLFHGKTADDVIVVAGPPSLIVSCAPNCDDPLWPYREFFVNENALTDGHMVCRRDGVLWPARSAAGWRA